SLVLLNNTSHDEEQYSDPWNALTRYAVCSTVDGVPLIFPGQELGISGTYGYVNYEVNFGKNIVHFKKYNSMQPIWNDSDYGNDQLYPVYSGIALARLSSNALRSSNRYYLDQTGGGGTHPTIFSVAKYETANASPGLSDVVFAFANIDRNSSPRGNFNVNITQNGSNLFGISSPRTYNVKNIAAYLGASGTTRRDVWLWGNSGRTGSDVLTNGVFVAMNKVPTDTATWATAPYEAQYLKVYDVTHAGSPASLIAPRAYDYVIGNNATFTWSPSASDNGNIAPQYTVRVFVGGTNT